MSHWNVGGTGKLPMPALKAMCIEEGFAQVQTYLASGNAVFSSNRSEAQIKTALEKRLRAFAGKPVGVIVRTAEEMAEILAANPWTSTSPAGTYVVFLDDPLPADALDGIRHRTDEAIQLGKREIYISYGVVGMGRSKLKIPAAANGTARNMNTVSALAKLSAAA